MSSFTNFELSEDIKELQALVREFTDAEVRPLAAKIDQENYYPAELWSKMADMGLFGLTSGEEYGGSEMGYLALAVVIEELSKGSGCMELMVSGQNGAFTAPIIHYGTDEQKAKYCTATVSGKMTGAFALSEPDTGSDARNLKTTAVLDGDEWVINGQKTFITNGDQADFIMTFCSTEGGVVCLIVDKDTPGMTVAPTDHKMGLHGVSLNTIYYENVRVPKAALVGEVGQGFLVATTSLAEARMCVAAAAVGQAQEAINLAVKYSKERIQFNKRLSEFQNTQFVLAEAQTKVDAARFLMYRSAVEMDKGTHQQYMSSMCKYYCSEVCVDVVRKCLQVFGGYGYCVGYDIERIYRDVKVWEILDGAVEIHKHIISKWMGVK